MKRSPMISAERQPTIADIRSAADRLSHVAIRTPLLWSPELDRHIGGRCFIKPETLQHTGSFKFRGAFHKIACLSKEARAAGVVAYSSGNHAQGVAYAAQMQGVTATIIMPHDAPRIKIDKTRAYGANIHLYERYFENRETVAADIGSRTGATLVKPYDDTDVIAGQGTCGLEISDQIEAKSARLDNVLICCGGGGLSAGSALAIHDVHPQAAIYSVEPADFDDHARSLISGERVGNDPRARSICDALLAPTPGELTFTINHQHLQAGLAVSDHDVKSAMAFAYKALKLVVEPGGAVALAAALSGRVDLSDQTTVIVLSGGNVDPNSYYAYISDV